MSDPFTALTDVDLNQPAPGVLQYSLWLVDRYSGERDRYVQPDDTEHPTQRARRKVEESDPAAYWGES